MVAAIGDVGAQVAINTRRAKGKASEEMILSRVIESEQRNSTLLLSS